MWVIYSLQAAFFAGITAIFAKIGVQNVDTNLATAIRSTIILTFSIFMVCIYSSFDEFSKININMLIFLILSGITTALLWLSYFKALQLGNVNKVAPIDKTSIVLTLILSAIFLKEKITLIKIISISLILIGTFLMISKSKEKSTNNKWIIYATLTAIFTSLATILGKIGIENIESNFGTMIRTLIVFIIIWLVVIFNKNFKNIKNINKKNWLFIFLSGITTGLSWQFYFKALQNGEASVVFSIEKLSIVIAIVFSCVFLKEKLNVKSVIGLIIIVTGTLLLII